MGIKEVKSAFQEQLGEDYNCTMATMDMVRDEKGAESQVLFFRVIDQNGDMREIRSDPIGGNSDLIQAAKDTAMRLKPEN